MGFKIIHTYNGLSEAEADLESIGTCLNLNFVLDNACGIKIKKGTTYQMFLRLLEELSIREAQIRGDIPREKGPSFYKDTDLHREG